MARAPKEGSGEALIIYDGACPFCSRYARLVRLRETVGPVALIDARSDDPRVRRYWREGYDLDTGMLFAYGGKVYYGSEAVHVLARLSGPVSVFNRINRFVFSSRTASTLLYPLLRAGRRAALWIRGRGPLTEPGPPGR
jgi:predicted DCC family thiol-disulfide oxidoreductase YuxK